MGRSIKHSSRNFTPDSRGKIHINKPLPGRFSLSGEPLDKADKEIIDYSNSTLGACATNVKLIIGVGGMRKT
jgi:hypothetical protein